jgi:hypothetical protein
MMRRTTIVPTLAAVVLAAGALGCASASVKSNKSAQYTKKLERTLIVFTLDERMQRFEQPLREGLLAELQKRGVVAAIAKTAGSLALEEAPPIDKQAKELNASTALFIRPAGGTVNTYGTILHARFDAQIFDLAAKTRVWRASIDYNPGGSIIGDSQRAEALIGELVKALDTDGLL